MAEKYSLDKVHLVFAPQDFDKRIIDSLNPKTAVTLK